MVWQNVKPKYCDLTNPNFLYFENFIKKVNSMIKKMMS